MSDARHEMEGMTAVPDTSEPWATRLVGPHPPAVSRAVGALLTCTLSRTQALMVAYTLADAGLLAEPADTDEVAEPEVTYTAGLPHIAGIEEYVRADPGWRVNDAR